MTRNVILITMAFLMIAATFAPVMAWGDPTHPNAAEIAANKMGIYDTDDIKSGSLAPDSWVVGGSLQHSQRTGALYWVDKYANDARNDKKAGKTVWKSELGYALHYMTDMSMPFHTSLEYNSVTKWGQHYDMEKWGGADMFEPVERSVGSYYINSPSTSADQLAATSSEWAPYFYNKMIANPDNWKEDMSYKLAAYAIMKECSSYNQGLVNYVIR